MEGRADFLLLSTLGGKEIYRDDNLNLNLASTRNGVILGKKNSPGIMEKLYKGIPSEEWPADVQDEIDEHLSRAARVPPGDPNAAPMPEDGSATESGYVACADGIYHGWNPANRERLSNFKAMILNKTVVDDGSEQAQELTIEVTRKGDSKKANISIDKFNSLDWVMNHFGPENIIWPGNGVRDHLRCAIQQFSREIQTTTRFTHTGWRDFNGVWCFLHAGGAITPDIPNPPKVEVALVGEAARYCLPAPPKGNELRNAVRASLGIIKDREKSRDKDKLLAPDHVSFPLLALPYRAALGSPDFLAWLKGLTGIYKSEMAALIQQHFGPTMVRDNLPGSWLSTSNNLEGMAFVLKDAVFVIDDFIPTGSRVDSDRQHKTAELLIRSGGNHAGRGRMRADTTMRPSKPPRGLILATAEELPRGHSGMARLCVLEMEKGDVDLNRLSACQKDASNGLYAAAMAGFISWLAPQYAKIQNSIKAEKNEIRDKNLNKFTHARTPDTIANLILGLRYLLRFAKDVGAIDVEEMDKLTKRGETAFSVVAAQQSKAHASVNPIARFADLIQGIIFSGRGHLAGVNGQVPTGVFVGRYGWEQYGGQCRGAGRKIGWVDGDMVYLHREAAYAEIFQFTEAQGLHFATEQRAFWMQLKGAGHIAKHEPGKTTYPRTLEGERIDVINLYTTYIFGNREVNTSVKKGDAEPGDDCLGSSEEPCELGYKKSSKVPKKSTGVPVVPVVPAFGRTDTEKTTPVPADDAYVEFSP